MTNEEVPLFDPRWQDWDEHFFEDDMGGKPLGRTAEGRATADLLWGNRRGVNFQVWGWPLADELGSRRITIPLYRLRTMVLRNDGTAFEHLAALLRSDDEVQRAKPEVRLKIDLLLKCMGAEISMLTADPRSLRRSMIDCLTVARRSRGRWPEIRIRCLWLLSLIWFRVATIAACGPNGPAAVSHARRNARRYHDRCLAEWLSVRQQAGATPEIWSDDLIPGHLLKGLVEQLRDEENGARCLTTAFHDQARRICDAARVEHVPYLTDAALLLEEDALLGVARQVLDAASSRAPQGDNLALNQASSNARRKHQLDWREGLIDEASLLRDIDFWTGHRTFDDIHLLLNDLGQNGGVDKYSSELRVFILDAALERLRTRSRRPYGVSKTDARISEAALLRRLR
ncbi:hypothetical protein [Jiella pacifica]|nr:hypothetical protein [Jiella pacifica]